MLNFRTARHDLSPETYGNVSYLPLDGQFRGDLRVDLDPTIERSGSSDAVGGDIPGDASTTTTITIGGSVQSAIETAGDTDWIRVELVAGTTYDFALNGRGNQALSDPFLSLRNSSGSVIASNDDGGPGLNSLITFTATTSGTYYLDAHAYGNETGNYTLTAQTGTDPVDVSITDTIDWGTQVSGSTFTVYFARTGQTFDGETAAADWTTAEKAAAMAAWGVFSDVANITFVETSNQANATFTLVKADLGADILGYFNPPGELNAGVGVFNHLDPSWSAANLLPGGYAFVTLVHEFGHGLGLAHPHDEGGTSSIMTGVTANFDSYGDAGLNQGVFTIMSYNDGWPTGPNGVNFGGLSSGWPGTLGPIDIAAIQAKYGVNSTLNAGTTDYSLPTSNSSGSMYRAIWDTSGVDTIRYGGSANAVIDLRAATLLNAAGGGGYVSYVTGILGGFTIANGVVIENAVGGSGDDTITGNDADNQIEGDSGNDLIDGGGGTDTAVYSGLETDYQITINGDGSRTIIDLRAGSPDGTDTLISIELLQFAGGGGSLGETLTGDEFANVLTGTAYNDTIDGAGGNDRLTGLGGDDQIDGGAGNDSLLGGDGNDIIYGGPGNDVVVGGGDDDTLYGDDGIDRLDGGDGDDVLSGGADNDVLIGGAGDDRLLGATGDDRIRGGTGDDVIRGDEGDDSLFGQDGSDQINGSDGNDFILGGQGDDFLDGDAGDDRIGGGGGNDTITGGDGNDIATGNGGDDTFTGGAGDDRFDGGGGQNDRAEFSSVYSDYQVEYFANSGLIRVTDLRPGSPDGVDRLFNVEVVAFADGNATISNGVVSFTTQNEANGPSDKADTVMRHLGGDALDGWHTLTHTVRGDAGFDTAMTQHNADFDVVPAADQSWMTNLAAGGAQQTSPAAASHGTEELNIPIPDAIADLLAADYAQPPHVYLPGEMIDIW